MKSIIPKSGHRFSDNKMLLPLHVARLALVPGADLF